jgi:hypothetical protein
MGPAITAERRVTCKYLNIQHYLYNSILFYYINGAIDQYMTEPVRHGINLFFLAQEIVPSGSSHHHRVPDPHPGITNIPLFIDPEKAKRTRGFQVHRPATLIRLNARTPGPGPKIGRIIPNLSLRVFLQKSQRPNLSPVLILRVIQGISKFYYII